MRARRPEASTVGMLAVFAIALVVGAQRGNSQAGVALPPAPISGAQYIFQPPPGWHRVQATAMGLGIWVHPGDTGYDQNISARADHFTGPLSAYVQLTVNRIRSEFPDAKIGSTQAATVCAGHASSYITYAATSEGKVLIYEQMIAIYEGTAYYAIYTRASSQQSLPSARHALTTLCGGSPPAGASAARSVNPSSAQGATGSPVTSTVAPQQTYGAAAPTVTPRLGP